MTDTAGARPSALRMAVRLRFAVLLRAALVLVVALVPCVAQARDSALRERPLAEARRGSYPAPDMVAFLGVVTAPTSRGLSVTRVLEGSAAQRAGLRRGDVLRTVANRPVRAASDLDRALDTRSPGETIPVSLLRDGALLDRAALLGGRRRSDPLFRGGLFRLAVVPVLFAGQDPPRSGTDTALRRFYFGRTGLRGEGASVADYFADQSGGAFRLEGSVQAPIRLQHARAHYAAQSMGGADGSLFVEAGRALLQREGSLALRDIDGLAFLYPGETESRPGSGLWPHRAVISLAGRRLPYFVHSLETVPGREIGEHCHEFSHLLGLPDRYGTGHITGPGDFCLMAVGHRGGPRAGSSSPFSLCAWCRSRLGWLPTVTVDPGDEQRLRIPPSVGRGASALVIPLDSGCREYLLLEARSRDGFDRELPSAGLLVWRVGGAPTPGQGQYAGEIDLIEAHGIDTFDASFVRTDAVAFPTVRARDLTPATIPSSSSLRPGTRDAYVTDIVRNSDGSVSVTIGVETRVVQRTPEATPTERRAADGTVARTDPITGETIRFALGADARTGGTGSPTRGRGDSRRR